MPNIKTQGVALGYLLIGLSGRHIVNNGRANLLFDTPTLSFVIPLGLHIP